jgi:hypothetical protein
VFVAVLPPSVYVRKNVPPVIFGLVQQLSPFGPQSDRPGPLVGALAVD